MGLLNKIGGVASDVSRNVNEKTKNMSDTSNLKRKILYEEERIMEFCSMSCRYLQKISIHSFFLVHNLSLKIACVGTYSLFSR